MKSGILGTITLSFKQDREWPKVSEIIFTDWMNTQVTATPMERAEADRTWRTGTMINSEVTSGTE
jgi:hypothetical protein